VTHIITDRIIDTLQYANIEVVQTQWIVDSCNFEVILPTNQYAPGADLPPHISPFKTYIKETEYLPERMKEILKLKGIVGKDMDDKS
jgi:pescadillo protein